MLPVTKHREIVTKTSLREAVHDVCRLQHKADSTESSYFYWMRRFYEFNGKRSLREICEPEVTAFLTHIAVEEHVSASTQNQALQALLFLYRDVYQTPLNFITGVVRAKRSQTLPVWFTKQEVPLVLNKLHGIHYLVCALLYGSGLRLNECITLRIKDLDFEASSIHVHEGKGLKDRIVPLPESLRVRLHEHVEMARRLWESDLADGLGWVELPYAFERKNPRAAYEFGWQWLFPAGKRSRQSETNKLGRFHIFPDQIQRAFKLAVRQAGILKRATCHSLRHSFATHLYHSGVDIFKIQKLLGHSNVKTTMIYTHLADGTNNVRSPLDF